MLARAYPASRFTGFDFAEEAIASGRAEAQEWGLSNARFEVCDVATLDRPDAFDVITAFDAVHDQAHSRTLDRASLLPAKPSAAQHHETRSSASRAGSCPDGH